MQRYRDFEDFLTWKFVEDEGSMIKDDDLPDATDDWMAGLSTEDLIRYADQYASEIRSLVAMEVTEAITNNFGLITKSI